MDYCLLDKAEECLRRQGGRMTNQRQLILETLDELETHPSAEELFQIVHQHDPSLNLSTVYRTLRWLEQEGLVHQRWFDIPEAGERPASRARFDPALPGSSEHHHFVCNQCGSVNEFDTPLAKQIGQAFDLAHGSTTQKVSIVLYGICTACLDTPLQV